MTQRLERLYAELRGALHLDFIYHERERKTEEKHKKAALKKSLLFWAKMEILSLTFLHLFLCHKHFRMNTIYRIGE